MGVLLFVTSTLPPQLAFVNEVTFGEHLRMPLVARGNNLNIGLELSVPLRDDGRGKRKGTGGGINHLWPII